MPVQAEVNQQATRNGKVAQTSIGMAQISSCIGCHSGHFGLRFGIERVHYQKRL